MPLTVCPLSNYRLQGVTDMSRHPLRAMLDAGLMATVNSDDPAYFGGYVLDNYLVVRDALDISQDDIVTLARNSIVASFLKADEKARWLLEIQAVAEE
jgi:adenosine deaminase